MLFVTYRFHNGCYTTFAVYYMLFYLIVAALKASIIYRKGSLISCYIIIFFFSILAESTYICIAFNLVGRKTHPTSRVVQDCLP